MSVPHPSSTPAPLAQVQLRILATTDLHGHVLAYDYIKDRPTQGTGLAGLATMIGAARREATEAGMACLLLDNGDTFQGTPLARHLAHRQVGRDHTIAATFNHLRFDAVGIGNHDLDHGVGYLRSVAGALDMPMLCANLTGAGMEPLQPSALIEVATPGEEATVKVGLLSLLPAQTAAWHAHHLNADRIDKDPEALILAHTQELRDRGADLVVLLAHMGVGRPDSDETDDRAAIALAQTGAIDAMILGHVHLRLPSPAYAGWTDVDARNGTIAGVPAVMAGHAGSDLAVLDLDLARNAAGRWQVQRHTAALRPQRPDTPPDPHIIAAAAPAHTRLRALLSEPVAQTQTHIHSYFSLAMPTPTQRLVARTLHRIVTDGLHGQLGADLPVLAAVAAQGAGGRDGPGNFVSIPPGQVLRRHIAGLNPHANQVLGIEITGAEVAQWLEHAAAVFTTLVPDAPMQPLVNDSVPAFQFDTIFGLSYRIDPSSPPYRRIRDLHHDGSPVGPDQRFILATNQFRVAGGGGYAPVPETRVRLRQPEGFERALVATLQRSVPDRWAGSEPWRFADDLGRQAILRTDPDARACLDEIAHLHPQALPLDRAGFLPLRLTL